MTALAQPTSNEVKREGLDHARRAGRTALQQGRILRHLYWLAEGQGSTRQDMAEALGLALSSVCGRCAELADLELIAPIGTVGKPARQVLGITEKGIDHLLAVMEDDQGSSA
ncbi:hypothetical protein M8009_00615 [Halomonas sp. ATCH28]|uniref:MarR family transcriptional regulator n=1 Tax=Halomonas gemina TaxID=2945105 RepID=A0ABT0SVW7_9GAMM|nr:hypothetical protein [Halomonas gemina]MCL7938805.1 hypothetical protein [Halomonas gemina]